MYLCGSVYVKRGAHEAQQQWFSLEMKLYRQLLAVQLWCILGMKPGLYSAIPPSAHEYPHVCRLMLNKP